jgi:hypothetical protein
MKSEKFFTFRGKSREGRGMRGLIYKGFFPFPGAFCACQGYFPLTIFSPEGHKETLIYQFLHQAIVVETIGLSLFCLRSLIDTFI